MGWNCGNFLTGGSGGNWPFILLNLFTTLLFWGALIAAGFYLIKALTKKQTSISTNNNSALEILKLRYAKGELSEAEFEKMKNNL